MAMKGNGMINVVTGDVVECAYCAADYSGYLSVATCVILASSDSGWECYAADAHKISFCASRAVF